MVSFGSVITTVTCLSMRNRSLCKWQWKHTPKYSLKGCRCNQLYVKSFCSIHLIKNCVVFDGLIIINVVLFKRNTELLTQLITIVRKEKHIECQWAHTKIHKNINNNKSVMKYVVKIQNLISELLLLSKMSCFFPKGIN